MEIDLSKYELQEEFPTLPAGEYDVSIQKVELKDSKSGNKMLVIDFKPVADDFRRYMVRDYFTLGLQVAMERLKSLSHAAGLGDKLDADKLQGQQVKIKTKVEEDDFGPKARILAFLTPGEKPKAQGTTILQSKEIVVEKAEEIKMPWENS